MAGRGTVTAGRTAEGGTSRPDSPSMAAGWWGVHGRWRLPKVMKYLVTGTAGMLLLLLLAFNSTRGRDFAHTRLLDNTSISEEENARLRELRKSHAERKRLVSDVCHQNHVYPTKQNLIPSKFRNIYVDDKHRFLYCNVPKVACTNFKRILLVLSGKVNTSDPSNLAPVDVHSTAFENKLKTLDEYTESEISHRLQNYYKFMFVRNPLERILSAYRNKFTLPYNKWFHVRYGVKIVKHFRKKPSKHALLWGDDVTFEEFVQYLLTSKVSSPLNEHWLQYYKLCSPCVVQYDAIGKYETLDADVDFVLKEIGVHDLISFPHRPAGISRTADVLNQHYEKIGSEQLHRLWELYAVDYAMFGYPYPDIKG